MSGIRKLRSFAPEELPPPANLWEVLERGRRDTFPIHTGMWLFKNAQGTDGAFLHLPGPEFGYRARDGETHSTDPNNAGLTLYALAWFLCLPAYGKGYLPAGPTAPVYGGLSEGFLEPPVHLPAKLADLPPEARDLLTQAVFPLTDLPTMSRHQIEYYMTLRFIKHSTIFGPLESQLIRRAGFVTRRHYIPGSVERDTRWTMDRAMQAFNVTPFEAWAYDKERHEEFVRTVRCRRQGASRQVPRAGEESTANDPCSETTSPYSPPYWGLPIFDLKPLFQEALRLIKLVPERMEWCPELYFMAKEDWEWCFSFRNERRFSKGRKLYSRTAYPRLADQKAAWDWVESLYGERVRAACYPSERRHK